MSEERTIFAISVKDPDPKVAGRPMPLPQASIAVKADDAELPVKLDMGEGSREQGFFLYGCR